MLMMAKSMRLNSPGTGITGKYFRTLYNIHFMKNLRPLLVITVLAFSLSSCGMLSNVFKKKEGCGTNGKNVGAEKIISGETPKKTPKFKA
jgi:hypothetical protein